MKTKNQNQITKAKVRLLIRKIRNFYRNVRSVHQRAIRSIP